MKQRLLDQPIHHRRDAELALATIDNAIAGVATPWLLFATLCVWIYSHSLARPGDNPVTRAVAAVEDVVAAIVGRLRPAKKAAA